MPRGLSNFGDKVDGTKDGKYTHAETEQRMAKEATRLSQRIASKPLMAAYAIIAIAVVVGLVIILF